MKLFNGMKVLALPDLHIQTYPNGNGWKPDMSPSAWAALDFGDDFKPDVTIILGDFMNFDIISDYTKKDVIHREGRRLKYDFILANQILDRIDRFTKGEVVFLLGNHDVRLSMFISANPQLEGLIGLTYNLHLEKRDYIIMPENKVYKLGHARFVHGWYYNLHHAKKTVLEMGDNIFYGHVHDVQSFSKSNPDQKPIIGQSMGCLCDLNPEYKRNKPNRWVNAFGIFYFQANGNFTHYIPIIINGEFTYAGKFYKGKRP